MSEDLTQKIKPPIPASLIRQLAREYSKREFDHIREEDIIEDGELCWSSVLEEELKILPSFDWVFEDPDPLPDEILEQLRGKELKGGMKITYQGKEHIF